MALMLNRVNHEGIAVLMLLAILTTIACLCTVFMLFCPKWIKRNPRSDNRRGLSDKKEPSNGKRPRAKSVAEPRESTPLNISPTYYKKPYDNGDYMIECSPPNYGASW